jgi:hypothetical protein
MRHRHIGFLFQLTRLASDETVGVHLGCRAAGSPLHVKSNPERRMTSPSILGVVESFGDLGFSSGRASYNSTVNFAEPLETPP